MTGAIVMLAAAGCRAYPPPSPDPGNRNLHQLAADAIFTAHPVGAATGPRDDQPAFFRDNGPFGGASWEGPAVIATVTSSNPVLSVYAFFDRQATADGWSATAQGAWHVTMRWTKTYPGGARATLLILPDTDPRLAAPATVTWRLIGSVLPPLR